MERPKDLLSFQGLSAMAFNKDFSMCAASHKDKYIYIYKVNNIKESSTWTVKYVLKSVRLFNFSILSLCQDLTGTLRQTI